MLVKLSDDLVPADLAAYYDEFWRVGGMEIVEQWLSSPAHRERVDTVIEMAKSAASVEGNGTAIDFGCGPGTLSVALDNVFSTVIPVDISKVAISMLPPELQDTAVVIDADRVVDGILGIADIFLQYTPADVAVASEVLEHTKDPRGVLDALLRVAAMVVVSVPINEPLNEETFNTERILKPRAPGDGVGHIWSMDDEGFMELVDGYDVVEKKKTALNIVALIRSPYYNAEGLWETSSNETD